MSDPIGTKPREHAEHVGAVESFTAPMVAKLDANANKAHWSGVSVDYLLDRLREEVEELADAMDRGLPLHIVDEAADVANFAMMIADRYRPREASESARWRARVKLLEARLDKVREAIEP